MSMLHTYGGDATLKAYGQWWPKADTLQHELSFTTDGRSRK